MRLVAARIQGTSPLLMNRFPLEPLDPPMKQLTREEQAEVAAYRWGKSDELYIPGINLQRCIVNAGAYSIYKGRTTMMKVVAAAVFVHPEHLTLGTSVYEIDSRAVVVPATRGRIVRHRPRIDEWEVDFQLEYDEGLINAEQLHTIVSDAGARVGLLDFRPEKKGPFGRFIIVQWDDNKKQG